MITDEGPTPLPAPSARSLLVTVLGDLVYPTGGPVWTSSLLAIMGLLGVEDTATRQAIHRSATAGWIEGERHGRAVAWQQTAKGRALAESGIRRSQEFIGPSPEWDGCWFSLTVSTAELSRATRRRLQGALTWQRLGNLMPGLWVSPRVDVAGSVREAVEEFGLGEAALALSGRLEIGLDGREIVRRAFDLTDLEESYRVLLDRYADIEPATADELLVTYLELVNMTQRFMRLDPMLPVELNPEWIGHDAAEFLADRQQRWAEAARARWAEIAEASAPSS